MPLCQSLTHCFVFTILCLTQQFCFRTVLLSKCKVSVCWEHTKNWYLEANITSRAGPITCQPRWDLLNFTASGLGLGNYLDKRMPNQSQITRMLSRCWTVQLNSCRPCGQCLRSSTDKGEGDGRVHSLAEDPGTWESPQLSLQGQGTVLLSLVNDLSGWILSALLFRFSQMGVLSSCPKQL